MLSSLAVAIGMSGGFAIGTGGGFEIGISGGFHRNTHFCAYMMVAARRRSMNWGAICRTTANRGIGWFSCAARVMQT